MRVCPAILAAVVVAAVAAGCDRAREDLGLPKRTDVAPAPAVPTGTGVVGEDASPVPAPVARVRTTDVPKGAAAVVAAPGSDASKLEANLDDVNLPLPKNRPPVLDESDADADTPRLVNTVLAEVNGEVITREDILGPLRAQMRQWRKEYSTDAFESRVRQVIDMRLRQAISQRLVVQEARAKLSEEEKKQIDTMLEANVKTMASQAGSPLQLEAKMRAEGLTLAEARTRERERMLVQRFLREKIAPEVHTTHGDLLNYYNQVAPQRYVLPTKVHLGLILIKKSDSATPAQAQALAGAVHSRAAGGEDFARLAQRYSRDPMASKGGDWGLVTQGAFKTQEVDKALFRLQAADVGPLVETEDAYYIVKAIARQEGRTIPFTEVQAGLEDEVREKKYNERVQKYIQELYERSYVRVMWNNL